MIKFNSRILRVLSILMVSVILTVIAPIAASAATTRDVTITATPTFISLLLDKSTWPIGVVAATTNYSTTDTYFTATNNGTVESNIGTMVMSANWTGGQGWIHSDAATAGDNTVGLTAHPSAGSNITIKVTPTSTELAHQLAAYGTEQFGLMMIAPTVFDDGELKTVILRLTIVQHTP